MEASKTPEKIYLQEPTKVRTEKTYDNDIEYVRTDAFIEKAEKYLEERFINDVSVIAGGTVHIQFNQAFENFINYLKGE